MQPARLAGLTAFLAVLACSGDPAPADGSASAVDGASASTPAGTSPASTDLAQDYRLTMPAVERYYRAQHAIYQEIGRNPELGDRITSDDGGATIADMEARFRSIPEVQRAIEGAGLDVREYTRILMALTSARATDEAVQGGGDRAEALSRGNVSAENLTFAEQNRAQLARMERELEEAGEG